MSFFYNPYLVGLSIIFFEWTTNFLISRIFNFDLGENNLSAMLIFLGAGYLISYSTKKKMGRSYNIKVVSTYFVVLAIIISLSFLGKEINLMAILFILGITIVFGIVSYFAIIFGQDLYVKSIKKADKSRELDNNLQ